MAARSNRDCHWLQVYGQYEGERSGLRQFYEQLGFDVLQQGEQLSLDGVASGITLFPRMTERFFVWQWPAGYSGGITQPAPYQAR